MFNKIIRTIRIGLTKRLYSTGLKPPTPLEQTHIEELRAEFSKFPVEDTEHSSPAEKAWKENSNRLREMVMTQDPREFLRWNVIKETMFVGNAHYVETELGSLRRNLNWNERWRDALLESPMGRPLPFFLFPSSSGNLIHQAYHVSQFEEQTAQHIEDFDVVLEFGGGYGSLCRLIRTVGFKGTYVIYDLPQFSALQRYFLRSLWPSGKIVESPMQMDDGVICTSCAEDINMIFSSLPLGKKTLFIATWSISEAPLSVRNAIRQAMPAFHAYLIAFQNMFEGIDNVKYFQEWQNQLDANIKWQEIAIDHSPGNRYLFGSAGKG